MHRQLVLAGFLVFAARTIVMFFGMDIVAIEVERGVASVAGERAGGGDRVHHGFIVF